MKKKKKNKKKKENLINDDLGLNSSDDEVDN